jgi:tetratricopeptide (TPR) repeat protein
LFFLNYTKNQAFNTIGTMSGLVLFSSVILAIIFPLIFSKSNPYRRLMAGCAAILFLVVVFFNSAVTVYLPSKITGINYDLSLAPWIVLAVSALASFIFSVSNFKLTNKIAHLKNASFGLLFLSVMFIVFNVFAKDMVAEIYRSAGSNANGQTMEAALRQQTSADISVSVLKQSSQAFFLGSGPGTFVYDYVKYKPQSANQDNIAWNLTFFSGSSEFINRIATTGLLGIIAFLLIIGLWTFEGFRVLTSEEEDASLPLAIFGGWVAIVVAAFYYPFNISLALLFWFLLGMIVVIDSSKKLVVIPLKSVRFNYAVSLIFVAITILELGLLVWNSKRYYAEVQYLAAASSLQKNDLIGAIRNLESAANSTDRLQDNYLTGLSQIYLAQAKEELNKQGAKPEEAFQAAAPYLKTAVEAAMLSTDTANPSNSANWAARGYIYRQLIGVSEGFDTWALNTYQKALTLEPNNPAIWVEIGQVYSKRNEIEKAKESFNKAIELRPQYIDPYYYLALIFDQQGDKASAIKELEAVSSLLSADDSASRENVAKAIQSLKDGKSLSGNDQAGAQQTNSLLPSQSNQQLVPGLESENATSSSSTLNFAPPASESASSSEPAKP